MDKRWNMRKKEQMIYLGIAIIVMVLLIILLVHILTNRQEHKQWSTESRLPNEIDWEESDDNPVIRVVIKTNGFQEITHEKLQFSALNGIVVTAGDKKIECNGGETYTILPDDEMFQNGTIRIEVKEYTDKITVKSLKRGYGTPSYRGSFELFTTPEGIVVVNELLLEEYLYAVVPSEMPASYEAEALKCQAVCARSYAYCHMMELSYPEYHAHVDDSTSFQVYGNSAEQQSTIEAVNETAGQKLRYGNQVVKTYYYSTSSGKSTSIEAWGTELTEENQYLKGVDICNEEGKAYEEALPWYRWEAVIPEQTLSNLIEMNTGTEIGVLEDVTITKQGVGNVVLQIVARGTTGEVTVDTENKIRSALGGSGYKIEKQDGTVIESTKLLPSAFFTIAKTDKNYIIEGGGYGHGIGMSQNGANEMAKVGKTYEEILTFFYPGTKVE